MTQTVLSKGNTAVITGGASGIGLATAQRLAALGMNVVLADLGADRLAKAEMTITATGGAEIMTSDTDVSDPEALRALDAAVTARFGGADVLMNNAAIQSGSSMFGPQDVWDRVMAVNLDSLMHCANKFREALAEAKGSVIIVSSISGYKANIGNPAYAASKAGAISLTKTLGQAWAPLGIRVNGLAPGLVDTKLTKITTQHPDRLAASLARIPDGRMGTPAEMAGTAIFLASPLASYVTGHTVIVDGGLSL